VSPRLLPAVPAFVTPSEALLCGDLDVIRSAAGAEVCKPLSAGT
jgi:hypothetical protein